MQMIFPWHWLRDSRQFAVDTRAVLAVAPRLMLIGAVVGFMIGGFLPALVFAGGALVVSVVIAGVIGGCMISKYGNN